MPITNRLQYLGTYSSKSTTKNARYAIRLFLQTVYGEGTLEELAQRYFRENRDRKTDIQTRLVVDLGLNFNLSRSIFFLSSSVVYSRVVSSVLFSSYLCLPALSALLSQKNKTKTKDRIIETLRRELL
jgi:hypothetical protein